MVYLITKQLKWPLERSSYDGGYVVGRSSSCLSRASCSEAYTRAASARIVRSEDGHPLGWPLRFCSLSPVAIRVHLRHPLSAAGHRIGHTAPPVVAPESGARRTDTGRDISRPD